MPKGTTLKYVQEAFAAGWLKQFRDQLIAAPLKRKL
jgi:hypothetical protein